MLKIRPIRRALVPVDSAAARRVSAPNYDEFQGDREVWEAIRQAPDSVLAVTMAHCDAERPGDILEGDSEAALARARDNFGRLAASPLTRELGRVLYIYEVVDPARPGVRQIGLGGLARIADIRTERTPDGPIIRNEGVRPPKARGRARLIEATEAIIGTVNNAVPDAGGNFARTLEAHADSGAPDFETEGAGGTTHRIWLVGEPGAITRFQRLLAEEPEAYVADGNHRSAAAAMLGHESFLAVFFPADRMGIRPYNRLVRLTSPAAVRPGAGGGRTAGATAGGIGTAGGAGVSTRGGGAADAGTQASPAEVAAAVDAALARSFELIEAGEGPVQPQATHRVGLYTAAQGWRLAQPRAGVFDPDDAAAAIDHDIVQRTLLSDLGIPDAADDRLTFVGANKDAAWLAREVDAGRAELAITLPAVTMPQFIAVCRQRRMMPPKSTWFEPKIRSGLVMAMLSEGGPESNRPSSVPPLATDS